MVDIKATKTRSPSAGARSAANLLAHIARIYFDPELGREQYGFARCGAASLPTGPAVRCSVEWLMPAAGLGGAVRGKQFVTTKPDTAGARPPDLVSRKFHAERRSTGA